MDRPVILLDYGWRLMQTGITKLIKILEGLPEPQFNFAIRILEEICYAFLVVLVYVIVLPSLREKHDEFLLRELEKRSLPPLNDVGLLCFRKLVYKEIKVRAREAVISLINQEREGEQIDRALLKNVLAIFVDIGMGNMEYYVNDFETELLSDTARYYSRKASNWIQEDSCQEYMMIKVEECLKREKDRVTHYLHSSTEEKLIEQVQEQLLSKVSQHLEKEHSGSYPLLREDKTENSTRMHHLFSKIPKGLFPVPLMSKQDFLDYQEQGTLLLASKGCDGDCLSCDSGCTYYDEVARDYVITAKPKKGSKALMKGGVWHVEDSTEKYVLYEDYVALLSGPVKWAGQILAYVEVEVEGRRALGGTVNFDFLDPIIKAKYADKLQEVMKNGGPSEGVRVKSMTLIFGALSTRPGEFEIRYYYFSNNRDCLHGFDVYNFECAGSEELQAYPLMCEWRRGMTVEQLRDLHQSDE
ncbi:hypothetical protein C5167_009414 [Papaver somniferum]|uniref:Cullin N-terminal domain-containing protein n=1 Tax=Papaver somniferum TaxID=3469 RepID=A0A4Y7K076_PAPSO|nr:hypothetical protein C5167_009414 [Papaver somniferum]